MYTAVDHQLMSEALAEAQKTPYLSNSNPRVGCVIVKNGQVIGKGFTQKVGAIMQRYRPSIMLRPLGMIHRVN